MKKILASDGRLLHMIITQDDFKVGRTDIVNNEQFLQCALLNMPKGTTFRPHHHIWKEGPKNYIAQESWIVISGKVQCFLYDLDNKLIAIEILSAGDASFTFEGGHTYKIMEDNTRVLEYKNGPYHGQQKDKVFI